MKTYMRIFLCTCMLAFSGWAPAMAANDKQIAIKDYDFEPAALTVPVGTKVTWTNMDEEPHSVAETNKVFHSAALDTKESYAYTFAQPGIYHYFCTLHPHMVGTITVQ